MRGYFVWKASMLTVLTLLFFLGLKIETGIVQAHPDSDSHEIYELLAEGKPNSEVSGIDIKGTKFITPEHPTVYLTFDDGPSKWTPQVLDILKEQEVKGTFFVVGELAEGREDTIRRIVNEGHALGNHSYDHEYKHLYRSFVDFWDQVRKTDDILTKITGNNIRLLRAPGGTYTNFDSFYFYYLQEAGYFIHDWNVDSGDSKRKGVPAEEIIRNVKRAKLKNELTVLLHDGAGHEETVKALPEIIRYFKDKGYRFEVLTEKVKPVTFRVGKVKWDRSVTERQHEQLLAGINEVKQASNRTTTMNPSNMAAVLTVKEKPEIEQAKWIALREWANGKGAVTWDANKKSAGLTMGGGKLELSLIAGKAVWSDSAQIEAAVDLSFKFENNRLYVLETEAEALYAEVGTTETV